MANCKMQDARGEVCVRGFKSYGVKKAKRKKKPLSLSLCISDVSVCGCSLKPKA